MSVIVIAVDEGEGRDWSTSTFDVAEDDFGKAWVGQDEVIRDPGAWAEFADDSGFTHWAYVDPPEAL